jgi:hypothetical protein
MVIIETPVFTKRVIAILSDEEYRLLQMHLINKPDAWQDHKGKRGLAQASMVREGPRKKRRRQDYLLLVYYTRHHPAPFCLGKERTG